MEKTGDFSLLELVECPRDAMQGWKTPIPTSDKIEYLNALLEVGFDILDFGSFVSARAIPQMADTPQVLKGLSLGGSRTRLLAIVANVRGAEQACSQDLVSLLGYPFSVSPSFQQRNANRTIESSLKDVEQIQAICERDSKELLVYLSMGFGNPYGDPYSDKIVWHWVKELAALGIKKFSLADTVGLASPEQVGNMTAYLVQHFPQLDIGVHLHAAGAAWKPKIDAALEAGCSRFDGALKGVGGCPLAEDELVGNIDTELMIPYFQQLGRLRPLHPGALRRSIRLAEKIFRIN
jgi:hydroxymethylglutaryl-CoA lyase